MLALFVILSLLILVNCQFNLDEDTNFIEFLEISCSDKIKVINGKENLVKIKDDVYQFQTVYFPFSYKKKYYQLVSNDVFLIESKLENFCKLFE